MENVLEKGQKNFTVRKCYEKKDKFRFDLSIQRNKVWKKEKKSLFIHSMLIGYPLADIYTMEQQGDSYYWVLDGKQRLTTFFDFIDNKFALEGDGLYPIDGEEVAGKKFEELSDKLKELLLETKVKIIHLKGLDREKRDQLFYRLNNGEPLNKMEQTRALSGEFMDKVVEVANTKFFKEIMRMGKSARERLKDVETVLQSMILLEEGQEIDGLGSVQIRNYVQSKREEGKKAEVFVNLYKVLGYMESAVENYGKKELRMFKKVNIPVIVKVAKEMMDKGMSEKEFGEKLVKFFVEDYEKDGEYAMLVKSGTSKKENIEKRIELLYKGMMEKELVEV